MSLNCLYSTSNAKEMKDHIIGHKKSVGSLKCSSCLVTLKDAENLMNHLINSHKNDIYQCNCCFHVAESLENIEKHRKQVHKDLKEDDCLSYIIPRC